MGKKKWEMKEEDISTGRLDIQHREVAKEKTYSELYVMLDSKRRETHYRWNKLMSHAKTPWQRVGVR